MLVITRGYLPFTKGPGLFKDPSPIPPTKHRGCLASKEVGHLFQVFIAPQDPLGSRVQNFADDL
jgi:hypothetical protein